MRTEVEKSIGNKDKEGEMSNIMVVFTSCHQAWNDSCSTRSVYQTRNNHVVFALELTKSEFSWSVTNLHYCASSSSSKVLLNAARLHEQRTTCRCGCGEFRGRCPLPARLGTVIISVPKMAKYIGAAWSISPYLIVAILIDGGKMGKFCNEDFFIDQMP